jgi:hypothetical protein
MYICLYANLHIQVFTYLHVNIFICKQAQIQALSSIISMLLRGQQARCVFVIQKRFCSTKSLALRGMKNCSEVAIF